MILNSNKYGKKHGNSLIELIVVMAMLGLLGGVLFSLIATGGSIFRKVSDNSDAQIEARMALSYVTVKLRQNDVEGGITVSTNVLRISKAVPSTGYWKIYSKTMPDGTLALIEDDFETVSTIIPVTSTIAEGVTFTANTGVGALSRQLTLTLVYSNGTKNLNEIITLRSD